MFFAGDMRVASGDLGVHQFSVDKQARTKEAPMGAVDFRSQYTVSEIIGFLNEFQTPPFVFERMFETGPDDMYYFSPSELRDIARLGASGDIAPNWERDSETEKLAPLLTENDNLINIEVFLNSLFSYITEDTCSLANLEVCSEKALCDLATTEFSNLRAWQNDVSLVGYVKEAKKRKLTCGVKQAKPIDLKQAFNAAPKIYRQQLQYALKHLGFYGYETDGLWGSGTQLALENFILANGLENIGEDKVFNNILSKVKVPSSFKTVKVPSSSSCTVNQTICGFADVYLCYRATLKGQWIRHKYAEDYVKEAKRRGLSCGVR